MYLQSRATVDEIHHESPTESYDDRDSIVTSCSVGLFEKPDSEIFLVKEEAWAMTLETKPDSSLRTYVCWYLENKMV